MKSRSFTLIELLIVVLILGILASIAIPTFNDSMIKLKFPPMLIDIGQIERAAESYVIEHGLLPDTGGGYYVPINDYSPLHNYDLPNNPSGRFSYEVDCYGYYFLIRVLTDGTDTLCFVGLSWDENLVKQPNIWQVATIGYGNHPWGEMLFRYLEGLGVNVGVWAAGS